MKVTLSLIKADIGSIGGHIKPSEKVFETVKEFVKKSDLIIDSSFFHVGDDIEIFMTHSRGVENAEIHKLAWDAFMAGTVVAKEQGLYGAGQDLLKDTFSGNVKGMGPGVAEMEFEERPNEPFVVFMADKTDPGAFNLPMYLSFSDPMFCAGLLLSDKMGKGFTYTIMDVQNTEADRVIELKTPEDIYKIASLLRGTERYIVESIRSNASGDIAAVCTTTRLHNIAGKYTGKDDPAAIVRTQKDFPATGEILEPYSVAAYVAGFMRGSHNGPLMPAKLNSTISYFDGPPIITGAAFCVQNGKLTEPVDVFDHPFWDSVREKASQKAMFIREQGFFGNAMLGMDELEYGGIVDVLKELDDRFVLRK